MKKVVFVFIPMSRSLVEVGFGDMRNGYLFVSKFFLDTLNFFHNQVPNFSSLGSKKRESRTNQFREGKESEFFSYFAMVSFFGSFANTQILIKFILGIKG